MAAFARAADYPRQGQSLPKFKLTETASTDYPERTRLNVQHSQGTVVFTVEPRPTRGSKLTLRIAQELDKPVLHLSPKSPEPAEQLRRFVEQHKITVLNVAGSRASIAPRIAEFVKSVLEGALLPQGKKPLPVNGANLGKRLPRGLVRVEIAKRLAPLPLRQS